MRRGIVGKLSVLSRSVRRLPSRLWRSSVAVKGDATLSLAIARTGISRRHPSRFVVAVATFGAVAAVAVACGGASEPSSVPPASDPQSASSPPASAAVEPSAAPPPSSLRECLRDLGPVNEKALINFPPPGPVEDWPEPEWTVSVAVRGAARDVHVAHFESPRAARRMAAWGEGGFAMMQNLAISSKSSETRQKLVRHAERLGEAHASNVLAWAAKPSPGQRASVLRCLEE